MDKLPLKRKGFGVLKPKAANNALLSDLKANVVTFNKVIQQVEGDDTIENFQRLDELLTSFYVNFRERINQAMINVSGVPNDRIR